MVTVFLSTQLVFTQDSSFKCVSVDSHILLPHSQGQHLLNA